MAQLLTRQVNVYTKRQFVESSYTEVARQADLLIAQIQVKGIGLPPE